MHYWGNLNCLHSTSHTWSVEFESWNDPSINPLYNGPSLLGFLFFWEGWFGRIGSRWKRLRLPSGLFLSYFPPSFLWPVISFRSGHGISSLWNWGLLFPFQRQWPAGFTPSWGNTCQGRYGFFWAGCISTNQKGNRGKRFQSPSTLKLSPCYWRQGFFFWHPSYSLKRSTWIF